MPSYQWLFNIFISLINLAIQRKTEGDIGLIIDKRDVIINAYLRNMDNLVVVEENIDILSHEFRVKNDASKQTPHDHYMQERTRLWKKFPQLLKELIALYQGLTRSSTLDMRGDNRFTSCLKASVI